MPDYSIIPDYHLHTAFSTDCSTDPEALMKEAMQKGLTSFCITDHNDIKYPDTPEHITFDLDMNSYLTTLLELKKKYEGAFDLRIGIEQGVMPETCEELKDFSLNYPELDFIICSTHIVDNMDPYYPDYFIGKDEKDAYRHYFEEILYTVNHFNDYDVYGHIDYILRYGPTKAENFCFSDYSDVLSEILKCIIKNGHGIELNTGSLYRGLDFAHPHPDILKLYKSLGGEILTLGSDSHDISHISYGFTEAREYLKTYGFRYFCTFKNRTPDFHPL